MLVESRARWSTDGGRWGRGQYQRWVSQPHSALGGLFSCPSHGQPLCRGQHPAHQRWGVFDRPHYSIWSGPIACFKHHDGSTDERPTG